MSMTSGPTDPESTGKLEGLVPDGEFGDGVGHRALSLKAGGLEERGDGRQIMSDARRLSVAHLPPVCNTMGEQR